MQAKTNRAQTSGRAWHSTAPSEADQYPPGNSLEAPAGQAPPNHASEMPGVTPSHCWPPPGRSRLATATGTALASVCRPAKAPWPPSHEDPDLPLTGHRAANSASSRDECCLEGPFRSNPDETATSSAARAFENKRAFPPTDLRRE